MDNSENLFHSLHYNTTPLILPNAWDVASARIFENLGAAAIATTSAGVAWSQGYPDGRVMPVAVQAYVAKNITRVIKIPLSVDFENGYNDNPLQVAENIKPLLDAGIAGINIEDGKDAPEVLAAKIEAIRKVANDYRINLFINVRTDVYLAALVPVEQRVEETVKRAEIYSAAGGNGLFVPALTEENEIANIVNRIDLPLNVMALPTLPKTEKLAELGVKRLSAGSGISQIIWQNAAILAEKFLKEGDPKLLSVDQMPYGKLQELFQ